ncbi:MAG: choloylglycine hydrolase [Clostridia bacterium]|nr:choloylglycine hydrolase [Clostridia bacterium]
MCTAVSMNTRSHYFGRNLDLAYHYDERVVIAPRHYPFSFRQLPALPSHLALIGTATVIDGYPLYYDATNEAGLSMAGLNFPSNAVYLPVTGGKDNISPFEFIPWVLAQCETIAQARALLDRVSLADLPFSKELSLSPLHWIIADRHASITVEPMADGLQIDDNPVGVLTNNPPFDHHMTNLTNYMMLSPASPRNAFAPGLHLSPYGFGMGAIGLPGDCSSASRFVRAAFAKFHSVCGASEAESVSQFFHILSSVRHIRGCVETDKGYAITVYSSCCNTDRGIYYYTTYENSRITAVDMHRENLDSDTLIAYPFQTRQDILFAN